MMRNIFQQTFSVIIDLIIVCIFTFCVICVADNSTGTINPNVILDFDNIPLLKRNLLSTFLIVLVLYAVLICLSKNSIGKLLTQKFNIKTSVRFIAATIADLFLLASISILIVLIVSPYHRVDGYNICLIVTIVYLLIKGLFGGNTIGQYLFCLRKNFTDHNHSFLMSIVQCFFNLLVLYILNLLCGIVEPFAICLNIIIVNLLLLIFCLTVFKTSLWNKVFHVQYENVQPASKNILCKLCVSLLIAGVFFFSVRSINNKHHHNKDQWLGFNYPYEFLSHSPVSETQPYVDFLKTQKNTPKEYILGLFNKYDIVVLMENFHGESTQWEMIEEIVTDSVFIKDVGHVFTEYGSVIHQDKIDTFLNTCFDSDSSLEKETAVLMNYMSGGFFHFLKNINQLNATLPDSLKVYEHFTDCIDWDYFSDFQISDVQDLNRDSLMADVVIRWYEKQVQENKRHKLLLITNSRHAFGYAGGMSRMKEKNFRKLCDDNEAQYIWTRYPDKTATVMQHTFNNGRLFFVPFPKEINHGIWSAAFARNNNRSVGFNLKNTPFGNDIMEIYPIKGGATELTFADFFTGMVFNKPYTELRESTPPYRKYAVMEEARRKGITDSTLIVQKSMGLTDDAYNYESMRWAKSISIGNFIPIVLFILLDFLFIINYIVFSVITMIKS